MDKPRQRGWHSDTENSSVPWNSVMVKQEMFLRNVPDKLHFSKCLPNSKEKRFTSWTSLKIDYFLPNSTKSEQETTRIYFKLYSEVLQGQSCRGDHGWTHLREQGLPALCGWNIIHLTPDTWDWSPAHSRESKQMLRGGEKPTVRELQRALSSGHLWKLKLVE